MMTETTEPLVWVGCLACYNSGRLNGGWIEGVMADDAVSAGFATAADLPNGGTKDVCATCGSEEFWVFDHEGYGPTLRGECSPVEAQIIAETLAEISDDERPAFFVYVSALVGMPAGPIDELLRDFRESFVGVYESEREYAEETVDELGYLDDAPNLARYFDYDSFARDLFMDDMYSVPRGEFATGYRGYPVRGIYVFRRNI